MTLACEIILTISAVIYVFVYTIKTCVQIASLNDDDPPMSDSVKHLYS